MKNYLVNIELQTVSIRVNAKNKTEAKKKALAKLDKRKASTLIDVEYPISRKKIYADEF